MKIKVHLQQHVDFSSRLRIEVEPVDYDKDEAAVTDQVFDIIEKELGGKKIEVVAGLEQTYVDFEIGGTVVEVLGDPWVFLSIWIPEPELRNKMWSRLCEVFEIVPRPPQDADDE